MNPSFSRLALGLASGLLLSQSAWATEAVVTPFLPRGVNSLVALNITSLVASEMDFMSEFDMVEQLEERPGSLNVACISKTSCLGPIGQKAGADQLVAGTVSKAGSEAFELYLVLFDVNNGTFIRRKKFGISSAPDQMADNMGGIVRELVTGISQQQVEQDASMASADDFSMDDDDFGDFEPDEISHRVGVPGNSGRELEDFGDMDPFEAELAARQKAEDSGRRRAEEEARRREEDARRRAEEDARRAEESRRNREREEELRRQQEARYDEESRRSDLDDIQFGSVGSDEIEIDDLQFGSAVTAIVEEESGLDDLDDYGGYSTDDYEPIEDFDDFDSSRGAYDEYDTDRSASYGGEDRYDSNWDDDSRPNSRERDLDSLDSTPTASSEPSRRNKKARGSTGRSSSRSSRPQSTKISSQYRSRDSRMGIALSGGVSSLRGPRPDESNPERTTLTFVTYGGEIDVPLGNGLMFRAGIEGHSTQRQVPGPIQELQDLDETIWNTITPVHAGLGYQFGKARVKPHLGGEVLVTPYAKEGFEVALGGRVRAGLDLMVTRGFGIKLDGSWGILYGSEFEMIEQGLGSLNTAPQLTIGTIILL
jgi:hypothetical protein